MAKKKRNMGFWETLWGTTTNRILLVGDFAYIIIRELILDRIFSWGNSMIDKWLSAHPSFLSNILSWILKDAFHFTSAIAVVIILYIVIKSWGETRSQKKTVNTKNVSNTKVIKPSLEIIRDEDYSTSFVIKIINNGMNNLEGCRANLIKLDIFSGNINKPFHFEKDHFSFAWEERNPSNPESPWPGKPICNKNIKFHDFELLKITQPDHPSFPSTNLDSANIFWIELCECNEKKNENKKRRITCEKVDDFHSIVDIGLEIELVAKFGKTNMVYPYYRRVVFEKELNIVDDGAGKKFYNQSNFRIQDYGSNKSSEGKN